jgi:hypothetical protein
MLKATKEKVEAALVTIGAVGVGWVSDRLRLNKSVVTSNLVNSITYSTSKTQGPISGGTDGKQLSKGDEMTVKIGSSVVYAARVEFGFVGKDSLGRNYNQAAKPYMRPAITEHKAEIEKVFGRVNG